VRIGSTDFALNVLTMSSVLWSEEEIEVSPNGYLYIKEPKSNHLLDEEQPILLHTTAALLQSLYPSFDLSNVLLRFGFEVDETCADFLGETTQKSMSTSFDEPETVEKPVIEAEIEKGQNGKANSEVKQISIPSEYQSYQKLKRMDNLSNQIHSALQDIRCFRHRFGGARSNDAFRGNVKVRALEHQQQRLLQHNLENSREGRTEEETAMNETRVSGNDLNDRTKFKEESIAVRLVRTLNSIRVLFPHLLPILNHPRRNDKGLIIGKTRYKTRRNGPMCWLLGTESFGISTCKQNITAKEDVKCILKAFLGLELALQVSEDSTGLPLFWSDCWIKNLSKRCNPDLLSPLKILVTKCETNEKDIKLKARNCEEIINSLDQSTAQRLDQQYQKAVRRIHSRLSNLLTSRFPGARVSIYGSCLSNLSLGKGSDVDMSLWIPQADVLKRGFRDGSVDARQYEQSMKNLVYKVFRKLSNHKAEFRSMTPITKARIPVITGTYVYAHNPFTEDGSINFDICFLNDIAVANSGLLREYSLIDPRARRLMMTVKEWAKEHKINSAKEKCLSSYAWMNLVVFYLQCIGFLPNLQSPDLMNAVGVVPNPEGNYWHFVNNLDTCTVNWERLGRANLWTAPPDFEEMPMSLLLYGFFEFYSTRFPFGTHAVSIKRANISLSKLATRKPSLFFSIEDPFETYDSYCPHDLGSTVNEYGSKKIMDCLHDAEDYLRKLLCSEKSHDGKLWPSPPFVEPEPTRRNAKKSGFKHFERPLTIAYDVNIHSHEKMVHQKKQNMRNFGSSQEPRSQSIRRGRDGNTNTGTQGHNSGFTRKNCGRGL